jgi:WD40 repeat protein
VSTLRGHEDAIGFAAWSPEGRRILTHAYSDGTTQLWKADGTLLATLHALARRVKGSDVDSAAAWSPDGQRVAVDTFEGVHVWTIGPQLVQRDLWLATPYCLDPADRTRILGEPPPDAERGSAECEAMIHCLRGAGGDLLPAGYDRCLDQLRRAREARYAREW